MTPRGKRSSAFVGQISVLDEAYTLLDVHPTPAESFIYSPPFRAFTITFHQQFRQFDTAWLPVDLRTEVYVDIGMLGFSIPLIRNNQVTRISDYLVNAATPDSLFESKRALVTDLASESAPDSLMETAGVVIPLSDKERLAFDRIDSTVTLDKVFKPEEAVANLLGDDDDDSDRSRWASTLRPFGWFNRVDGFYLSARPRIRSKDRKTRLQTEIGYATAIDRWTPGVNSGTSGGSGTGFGSAVAIGKDPAPDRRPTCIRTSTRSRRYQEATTTSTTTGANGSTRRYL